MVNEVTSLSCKGEKNGSLQVYIGGDGPVKDMEDCSLITANYDLGGGMKGIIGVIGPKRMDYEKVMQTLNNLGEQLSSTLGDGKQISFNVSEQDSTDSDKI